MKVTSVVPQHSPFGVQASLGLFGVPGIDAPRQPLPSRPPASRIKGALNSFDSDGLSATHYRRPAAPVIKLPPLAYRRCLDLDDEPELAHSRWLANLAEARGCPFDKEETYARSFAGAGHAEYLMALEG